MDSTRTVLSSIAATSAMTAFSYLMTDGRLKDYREPELLASFLEIQWPHLPKSASNPAGWASHYAFGLAWALVHKIVLDKSHIKRNAQTGLLFGSFGGLTAVIIWKLLFKLNPKPPRIDYQSFYTHLVVAQIIFTSTLLLLHKESNT